MDIIANWKLKWFDFFIIILLIRTCYIAIKCGIIIEIFKTLGTILAIFLSLHFYTFVSESLNSRFSISIIPLEFLDFLVFVLLAICGYFAFLILRMTFLRLVKTEAISLFNKWGGLTLGILRGILLIGLVTYALVISSVVYLKTSVNNSYFGKTAISIAPSVYRGLWTAIVSKFSAKDSYNQYVDETKDSLK